jgi:hypothetical protein
MVLEGQLLAPLRHADARWECPELEADRKWMAHGQADANDPVATSCGTATILCELFDKVGPKGVRAVHHRALRQIQARHLPLRRTGALCTRAADDAAWLSNLSVILRSGSRPRLEG